MRPFKRRDRRERLTDERLADLLLFTGGDENERRAQAERTAAAIEGRKQGQRCPLRPNAQRCLTCSVYPHCRDDEDLREEQAWGDAEASALACEMRALDEGDATAAALALGPECPCLFCGHVHRASEACGA